MFEQTFIPGERTRKPWTVAVAIVGELAFIGVLILIPLIFVQTLPPAELMSTMLSAPPPPPSPPPPSAVQHVVKIQTPRLFHANELIAPVKIPKQVAMIQDQPIPPATDFAVVGGVPGGVPGGTLGGVIGGVLGSIPAVAPPKPKELPKPEPKPPTPSIVDVGGRVQSAKLVRRVSPRYPVLARDARVQGTVTLQAVIGKNGKIQNLQALSGNPLLIPAAVSAVEQWVYEPTYLNGSPVEVKTEVVVHFQLS